MNDKLLVILAIGMIAAAVGLYSWAHNGDAQASEPTPPTPKYRVEDHLTFIEFELDDGTPCVMVAAPGIRTGLAGHSVPGKGGVSCNWGYNAHSN